ncbi:MAG: molybdopterin-guanine dinucleotide biosynthesis protein B [Deltaproteobacteria bacterium]|nr:molybdopterin-guanine dinucleotide biosynthesis protein B [Deltaproteobacteria bacterium]
MRGGNRISREKALALVLERVHAVESVTLPLDQAVGHVLAEDVYAGRTLPPEDHAAMDGYAVRSRDTVGATADQPIKLGVVGEIHPSTAGSISLRPGECARILTGGTLPAGADAVVKAEEACFDGDQIAIRAPARPGQYVSKKGKDVQEGRLVSSKGSVVTPAALGLLAALWCKEVVVIKPLQVALLAIGNELAGLKDSPVESRIVASNLYMVSAMVRQLGARVSLSKVTQNNVGAIMRDLKAALQCDMVITFGGTSRGNSDLTLSVMKDMGVRVAFSGVAMRPGKGTSFGLHGNTLVFALPGTPSAVFSAYYTFVVPAIGGLLGLGRKALCTVPAVLEKDVDKKPGVEHVVQVRLSRKNRGWQAMPLTAPDLSGLLAMNMADGLIRVPRQTGRLGKGTVVRVEWLAQATPGAIPPCEASAASVGFPLHPPVVSIVGKSDSGKTSFLERLVPELTARGYRVGTIKHDVHGFEIDHEGKDSWRHKQAGASTVVISSPAKVAVVKDVDREKTIDELSRAYFESVDIILTEGYKKEDQPKIEVFRSAVHRAPLCQDDDRLIAMVSDTHPGCEAPCFGLDDVSGLADLLEQRFLAGPRPAGA